MEAKKGKIDKALSAVYQNDLKKFIDCVNDMEDLNSLDKEKRSLVFYVVLQNKPRFLEVLLEKNINVDLKDGQGWTPLHYAANEYFVEICKLLIDAGADVNAKDSYGNTVVWRAVFASKGRGDIIKLLLKNKANPLIENDSGKSAASLANTIANYDVKQFFQY